MNIRLKQLLHLPIYRKDILDYVILYHSSFGLCESIYDAMHMIGYTGSLFDVPKWFPLFTFENASRFGADNKCFWWTPGDWSGGRMEFLKWLRKEYRKDKTKLSK